jgi:hypothetical protein
MQMTNRHMKRHSTSLTRKIQTNPQGDSTYDVYSQKLQEIVNVSEDMGKGNLCIMLVETQIG